PPYMEETDSDSTRMPPIYDKFMEASYKVGDKVELITPARFLFNAGYTPKKWNEKMLSDEHFQVLYYEPNATNIFPNTDIKGGVAITYHDITTEYEPIRIFSKYPEQNQILRKVSNMHPASFTELVYPALSYKATKVMTLENRQLLEKQKSKSNPDPKELRFRTSAFNVLEEIFFENKPSDGKEYIRIIGLKDSKRTYRWVDKRYISCPDNFEYYKVIMPKSNGSGQISDVISSPLVGNPGLGHTQTFISIGKFNSELEANNCLKYIKTKFARVMLSVKKITQDNPPETWRFVPQQDFSQSSDINWNGSIHEIDMQLYAKYKLTDKEIQFVEDNVKEME
ncbi:MAG: Eco57I restriction-modification methylase domain-containing protein, partial [Eubacteriales bacterium]|nr:Eco57I restriction-modification methylase domain-containing protein [Eubacteriales bacterium]